MPQVSYTFIREDFPCLLSLALRIDYIVQFEKLLLFSDVLALLVI